MIPNLERKVKHYNRKLDVYTETMVDNLTALKEELKTITDGYKQDKKFSLKRLNYILNERIPHYTNKIKNNLRIYKIAKDRLNEIFP